MAEKEIKVKNDQLAQQSALFNCESTMFCLDTSGSMRRSRWPVLVQALRKYIQLRMTSNTAEDDLTGMVVFPSLDWDARTGLPGEDIPVDTDNMTDDQLDQLFFGTGIKPQGKRRRTYSRHGQDEKGYDCQVVFELQKTKVGMAERAAKVRCTGGTPMGDGLKVAIEKLDDGAVGIARIVLMTDGDTNAGRIRDYEQIVALARDAFDNRGIIVDVVGIQPHEGTYRNEELVVFLKKIADAGGGKYTQIDNTADFHRYLADVQAERQELIGRGTLLLGDGSDS
jgi:hypothetical protein